MGGTPLRQKEGRFEIALHGAFQVAGAGRGGQGVDDVDGGGEVHAIAAQAGGMTEGDQQMSFAEPNVTQQDSVGFLADELQTEQILQLRTVDFLRPAPVELIEGFEHGEAGEADTTLRAAVFAAIDLALHEPLQVLERRPPLFNMVIWRGMTRLTDIELGFQLGSQHVGN